MTPSKWNIQNRVRKCFTALTYALLSTTGQSSLSSFSILFSNFYPSEENDLKLEKGSRQAYNIILNLCKNAMLELFSYFKTYSNSG